MVIHLTRKQIKDKIAYIYIYIYWLSQMKHSISLPKAKDNHTLVASLLGHTSHLRVSTLSLHVSPPSIHLHKLPLVNFLSWWLFTLLKSKSMTQFHILFYFIYWIEYNHFISLPKAKDKIRRWFTPFQVTSAREYLAFARLEHCHRFWQVLEEGSLSYHIYIWLPASVY